MHWVTLFSSSVVTQPHSVLTAQNRTSTASFRLWPSSCINLVLHKVILSSQISTYLTLFHSIVGYGVLMQENQPFRKFCFHTF